MKYLGDLIGGGIMVRLKLDSLFSSYILQPRLQTLRSAGCMDKLYACISSVTLTLIEELEEFSVLISQMFKWNMFNCNNFLF